MCCLWRGQKSLQYKKWGVQSLSCVQLFATLWTTPSVLTISQSLHKFISIESMKSSNHLVICQPFSSCLQSCPKSGSSPMSQPLASGGQSIGASGSASVLSTNIRVGTRISFKVDWFGLLSVQGTPKSLLQHHSSKASILQCSAFFSFFFFQFLFYFTLTFICDCRKSHSFDSMDLGQKSDVSAFQYAV